MKNLYLSRYLQNGEDIYNWAKSQGFSEVINPEDMHVTIMFSWKKIDWSLIDPVHDIITISEFHTPQVQPFGASKALTFESEILSKRHESLKNLGAKFNPPSYIPHVALTYGQEFPDLNKIVPYKGSLILGPERVEEIIEDWNPKQS